MTINITLGGYQPITSLLSRTLQLVEGSLAGQLRETVHLTLHNNIMDLGKVPGHMPELVKSGDVTLGYIAASYLADVAPELYVFDLPFEIKSREQAYRLVDGPFTDLVSDKLAANAGLKLLGIWEYGFRHFTNASHPIRTPSDCIGLPIRTLLNELHPKMFKALGFDPEVVQLSEFLERVRAGETFAQENALTNYYSFGLQDFHQQVTLSHHLLGMALFICDLQTFETWPSSVQTAILVAGAAGTKGQRPLAAKEEENILTKLTESGCQIHEMTDDEKQAFDDILQPLAEPYRGKIGRQALQLLEEAI
tara:strand:+ start:150 stop:1073 length:924 start_codon:yes stop_codon:yes gene_type:complete